MGMENNDVSVPKTNPWVAALGGVALGVAVAVGVMLYINQDTAAAQQLLQNQLQQYSTQLQQAQLQLQTRNTQLSLDQATLQALEQRLQQKQAEIGQLTDQLAFYEHLLPLSGKSNVNIRALDLEPKGDVLHYRLLLQRPAGLEPFNGLMKFTAHGQQNGASVNIVLNTAGADPADTAAIQFDQFLRTTGLLQLPLDLKIDAVTLHIYQGKQLRATHKIDLNPA